MSNIQPPLGAEFRQFLRDRFSRPNRPRWTDVELRSFIIFLFGVVGFFVLMIATILLTTMLSAWFALGFLAVAAYTTVAIMFQTWYDEKNGVV